MHLWKPRPAQARALRSGTHEQSARSGRGCQRAPLGGGGGLSAEAGERVESRRQFVEGVLWPAGLWWRRLTRSARSHAIRLRGNGIPVGLEKRREPLGAR